MAAVIVVCIVSVVDSEADRCDIVPGFNSASRADDPGVLAAGDGKAFVRDEVENVDIGDNPAAVGVDMRLSSLGEGLEDRMQEANAAK